MKAGQSVAQSLSAVTDNAGPPLSEEFGLARREMSLAPLSTALSPTWSSAWGATDLRLVVMVITIQHSVGGDLPADPYNARRHHEAARRDARGGACGDSPVPRIEP